MNRRARHLCLAGIVCVAAAVRLWGLDLALPNVDGRPDEREMLAFTAGFPTGDFNPRWFVYPNLFLYLSWIWIEGMLALRRLVAETPAYAVALRDALPTVLLAGRLLSAVAGTLTVALLASIAARGGRPARGLVAATVLATCWLHVRDSHFLKTEALLALAVLAAVAALARWAERGRRRDAVVAGVALGLAVGIKYPAILLAVAAYVADRLRGGDDARGLARLLPSRDFLLLGTVGAATFLLACPYLVLDFARTQDTAAFLGLALYAPRAEAQAAPDAFTSPAAWVASRAFAYHVTVSLRHGLGLVALVATPAAITLAFRRREPLLVLAATFSAVFFLVAGASPVRLARYMTPLTPLLALLLAELVCWLAERARPAWRRPALAVATLLLVAEPFAASIRGDRIMATEDTRVQATRWMERSLPAKARVAVLGSMLLPQGAPALPPGTIRHAGPVNLAAYRAAGVTHVVTHDHPLLFSTVDPAAVARLAPALHLLADFDPFRGAPTGSFEAEDAYYVPFFDFAGVVRPGPHVRIHAFGPTAGGDANRPRGGS